MCIPPPQPERLVMRKDEAVGTGQQEKNASLFTCDLIIFCRVSLYIKNRRGLVKIPFNRYSKLYGAAGKLTTHGSQHFHKQNALKAVAFSVADPDPGSGAFLTPGSRIRNRFFPDPGSQIHIFWVKSSIIL
jgi:hypothetical protein